ncbi:L-lactate dehydrogenase [Clostridium sp. BNL1100]|uniref:L-lactate dehydrogenase n=1 Tax=Clostridium sp. BNL1100 TaxID=755731 RepID=UPI00024A7EDC|nr:L-lactate dehydrogenase [Clostridium sp. BNL1100]AEY64997.1 L-lactate dehydrogenase [Clostridium sp. BNL1100]
MKNKSINKIVIVGTGFVGSTTAYTLMVSGLVSEIVLIDQNTKKAEGEAMDMNHGMPFVRPVRIYNGDYEDCKGADIVVITGGANQKPGETRIDLVNKNTEIFKDIVGNIVKYNTDCILLVVTNPVDILTYVTYKLSGFPKNRVIGSGTVLDTARFKYMLGEHMGVDPRNVHAYIIGEHGDTEVPTWSLASIAGIPMDVYCKECKSCDNESFKRDTFDKVKNAAYEIIDRKNATYYAVALAVRRIVEAIVRNENSILTVSSLFEGEYGLNDICLSIPSQVNSEGVSRILNVPLSSEETGLLNKSAQALKQVISGLNL